MNIVYVNTVCHTGSTGKITVDLYHLAEENNYNSFIAYGRNTAPLELNAYKISNKFDFLRHVALNFITGKNGYGSRNATLRFLKWLDTVHPFILHLHNIHGFYLHVGLLFDYIKKNNIKVVWTLHDCWSFTGQCAHFDYINCQKWQTQCHDCAIYRTSYPYSLFKDNSYKNYIQKKEDFSNVANLTIVTPSKWLAALVKSSFLKSYPIQVIHNGINLNLFHPSLQESSFSNAKNILGVANVWTESKGLSTFLSLAKILDDSYHITLVGLSKKQQAEIACKHPDKITALCRTQNIEELVSLYNQADVYINPTLEDNFPTTNLEALACGTPVITYQTGGSPESIDSSCGIVVEKGNITALYNAIISLDSNQDITRESCRERALMYDKDKCFQKYMDLYKCILS